MEFENNRPTSDAERHMAEAKRLTLQPVHSDLAPETLSDSEIASRHIIEPAINNTPNDIEQTAAQLMPTKSLLSGRAATKPQTHKLMTGIISGTVVFAGLAIFALLK